jgi:hypothetical protein
LVILCPQHGDDLASFEHETVQLGEQIIEVLRRRPNGDCVYLDPAAGCTIHGRAPAMCRAFDCRAYFLGMTRNERRDAERHAGHKSAVFAAGRGRLKTLTEDQHTAAIRRRGRGEGVYLGDERAL